MEKNVAVVGGGLSGCLVVSGLIEKTKSPVLIYHIEKKAKNYCRGIAYANSFEYQPLNVPASKMSFFAAQPNHFVDWLTKNKIQYFNLIGDFKPDDFISRKVYGDYVEETFKQLISHLPSHIQYLPLNDEVLDVEESDHEGVYNLVFENNRSIAANKIVFALGNFPPADLPVKNPDFYKSSHYVSSPWAENVLDNIQTNDSILFVGAGLTMIDILINLKRKNHQGKIFAISRNGYLPQSHAQSTKYDFSTVPDSDNLSVNDLLVWIKSEVKKAKEKGIDWISVIDALRPYTSVLWQKLSVDEKHRFLRHLRPFWEMHRHRVPSQSYEMIQQMKLQNKFSIHSGKIIGFELKENRVEVEFKPRKKDQTEKIIVDKVINCTGPECNYRKLKQSLIQNLMMKGMIVPDSLHLGLETTLDGFLVDNTGKPSPHFLAIGSVRKGSLWETTALNELRIQANKITDIVSAN